MKLFFNNEKFLSFHRAFDNGLISIDAEYRLLVHPKLTDYNPATGIRQYEHKTIFLPKEERFYPTPQRLAEHRLWFQMTLLWGRL